MEHSPILEALKRTPPWVFLVFLALIVFGYTQSRERTVPRARLVILPAAMLCLSLYGVGSSFGVALLPLAAWVVGFLLIVACVPYIKEPAGLTYFPDSQSFRVPGSLLPFVLVMAIFCIRYITGYALARGLSFAHEPWFVGAVSISLGALGGIFAARAATIWRCIPRLERGVRL